MKKLPNCTASRLKKKNREKPKPLPRRKQKPLLWKQKKHWPMHTMKMTKSWMPMPPLLPMHWNCCWVWVLTKTKKKLTKNNPSGIPGNLPEGRDLYGRAGIGVYSGCAVPCG